VHPGESVKMYFQMSSFGDGAVINRVRSCVVTVRLIGAPPLGFGTVPVAVTVQTRLLAEPPLRVP
jgi:hypothetical protein